MSKIRLWRNTASSALLRQRQTVDNDSITLGATVWRDQTSDFNGFGVRLSSVTIRLLQRSGKYYGRLNFFW
jgi:hypothetical protein